MCYCRPEIRTMFCANCAPTMYSEITSLTALLAERDAEIENLNRQLDSFRESTKSDCDRINKLMEEQSSWSFEAVKQFNRADDIERQLTALLAERDAEIARLADIVEDAEQTYFRMVDKYNARLALQAENAALREEVERLTERLQANAAKIDEEDVVIEWADYLELKAEARKHTAREILQLLDNADWACSTYEETYYQAVCAIKSKFGLEG